MRKILFAMLGAAVIAGCKEKSPGIVLVKKAVEDSAYTLSKVPATDPHNVLVEEFTGQRCSLCPEGRDVLDAAKDRHEGRVIVLGLYKYNFGQTEPPLGARYDFRDSTATVIADEVYNSIGSMPVAGIDRVPLSGSLKIARDYWSGVIDDRMQNTTGVLNLNVESRYNSQENEYIVTTNIVYTKTVKTQQNLAIAIVEDSMVDKQHFPWGSLPPDDINPAYTFIDVFRGMITSAPYGDAILADAAEKKPGMALQRRYIYKLKPGAVVNPARCRVVAFVVNAVAGDGHVEQAAEARLRP